MNKRTFFILALVAALALPTAAMAAAEFSLGGYIKLEAFWDSTQQNKNMNTAINRDNNTAPTAAAINGVSNFHHGRLKFTSQSSRFNFTIKGPKLWGATTMAFIEMDMDQGVENGIASAANSPSNNYTPRLRQALFRLNWPETELLMGQTFTFVSQWFPELAQDGPFQMTGTPTARMPMIKLTQQFLGAWQVGVMVGEPNLINNGQAYSALNDRGGGESTEAPQVQVQAQFAQDLYGKAAWYGKPTPFTAQINAGWQRGITPSDGNSPALMTTDQSNYNPVVRSVEYERHQYHDPWILQANFFIPVIPTHSANLAGSASIQTSWFIGQGVEAFGWSSFGSQVFRWRGRDAANVDVYDVDLMSRWGGQVQAQYYFNNQWFLTGAYGISRAFNLGAFQTDVFGPNNKRNAFAADTVDLHQEAALCLWYRPITAFKFGLQYSYNVTNWIQAVGQTGNGQANFTRVGEAHRVDFVGLFFF